MLEEALERVCDGIFPEGVWEGFLIRVFRGVCNTSSTRILPVVLGGFRLWFKRFSGLRASGVASQRGVSHFKGLRLIKIAALLAREPPTGAVMPIVPTGYLLASV